MSKTNYLLILTIMVSTHIALAQKSISGHWEGAFIREGAVQLLEVDLNQEGDSLYGSYNIEELEIFDEPIRNISFAADTLMMRLRWGDFYAIPHEDYRQMAGFSIKWNPKIKLHLKRYGSRNDFFKYQDLKVKNKEGISLSARWYTPTFKPSKSIIILVHGSGEVEKTDRYYKSTALALVKRGHQVVTYDKRGVGNSEGNFRGATLFDLADDAISILQQVKQISTAKLPVGLMGISQGGWVGTIASHKSSLDDFLILDVGAAVSLYQQEIDRVVYTLKEQGYSDEIINLGEKHTKLMFDLVQDENLWEDYLASSKRIEDEGLGEIINYSLEKRDAHISWWRANKFDPREMLQQIDVPVLSLMGEIDPLVPPATNFEPMESYLQNSNAPFYRIEVIEGASHDLNTFGTLTGDAWEWPHNIWLWPHKGNGVYDFIDGFIKRLKASN